MKKNKRVFIPGDQWIYYKIYLNENNAEKILREVIAPVIKKCYKKQLITKWFFIRYGDPDFHLRVRFLLTDSLHINELIEIFNSKATGFLKNKSIQKIQIDTYVRELERYGEYTTELTETFFHIDSDYTLKLIKQLNKNVDINFRWLSALLMIDDFFNCFDLTIEKKKELITYMSDSYKLEFGYNRYNSKQFNSKFRENRKMIELLFNQKNIPEFFQNIQLSLSKKRKDLHAFVEEIRYYDTKKVVQIDALLPSYIHMMLNRLFVSSARLYELIIYDFLKRVYEGQLARRKYSGENKRKKV